MKRIVFCDVDGTLLDSENQVSARTVEAIKQLQKQGIPFVITSARSPFGITPILEEYGLKCPMICYSGSLILDEEGNVLYHRGMTRQQVKEMLAYMEEQHFDLSWRIHSVNKWVVKSRKDARIQREEQIIHSVPLEGDVDILPEELVSKLLCICDPAQTLQIKENLRQRFPKTYIVSSSDILVEVMEEGVNKATAVKELCRLWEIPLTDAAAFGDHFNDVEMLETVGHGYLMGNAPEQLQKRIGLHTADNDHDGICKALLEIGWI